MQRLLAAIFLALVPLVPLAPIPVLAGTTGSLAATVTDERGEPISGARVTVSSPSARCESATDAHGFVTCLALPPDTYALTLEKAGYNPVSIVGIEVFADQQTRIVPKMTRISRSIVKLIDRPWNTLVLPGVTTDYYRTQGSSAAFDWMQTTSPLLQSIPGVLVGGGSNYLY